MPFNCAPKVSAGDLPTNAQAATTKTAGGAPPSKTILVVEDNPVNQQIFCHILGKLGWEYTFAGDGKQALTFYRTQYFDLLLMDCQMRLLSGYDATREIRGLEALQGGHVPIIAMTAHALDRDRQKCLESGMDDYLTKPFEFSPFRDILVKWTIRDSGV